MIKFLVFSIFKLRSCLSVCYGNYVYITPEANCFMRMILRFFNNTICFFLHFWMFVRGIDDTTTNSNCLELNKVASNNFNTVRKNSSSLTYYKSNLNDANSSKSILTKNQSSSQTITNTKQFNHDISTNLSNLVSVGLQNGISSADESINTLLSQNLKNSDLLKSLNLTFEEENALLLHDNFNDHKQLNLNDNKQYNINDSLTNNYEFALKKKETKIEKKKSIINKNQAIKSSTYLSNKIENIFDLRKYFY